MALAYAAWQVTRSGNIHIPTGSLRYFGHSGNYWLNSADLNPLNAYPLTFNNVDLYLANYVARSLGFDLRCLNK